MPSSWKKRLKVLDPVFAPKRSSPIVPHFVQVFATAALIMLTGCNREVRTEPPPTVASSPVQVIPQTFPDEITPQLLKFRTLALGMSYEDVVAIMGPPSEVGFAGFDRMIGNNSYESCISYNLNGGTNALNSRYGWVILQNGIVVRLGDMANIGCPT